MLLPIIRHGLHRFSRIRIVIKLKLTVIYEYLNFLNAENKTQIAQIFTDKNRDKTEISSLYDFTKRPD